jgi:hypothetical protein
MMADGRVTDDTENKFIRKSVRVVATTTSTVAPVVKLDGKEVDPSESKDKKITWYKASAGEVGLAALTDGESFQKGEVYIATWEHPVAAKTVITIKPDSFPGTYYVTGDTMIRSERTGKDEYFQFIIPKAKMTAEQTISLEAEGDPTTFNMSLQVLRPESGEMLQFIKYEFDTEVNNAQGDGFVETLGL